MTTPIPDRDQIVPLLVEQWRALTDLVSGLDEQQWRTPTPLPGWTVFDVIAHIVGTESMLLGEKPPAHDPNRTKTDVRSLAYVHNETAVLNEIWIDRLRPLPGARLLDMYDEVTARRAAALADIDARAWARQTPSPVGQISYGAFMRMRLFDCWAHELDIADALDRQVNEGGARGEMAFTEFAKSIPRVVAKRGEAPSGSQISFTLSGQLTHTLYVAVGDRANYVEGFTEPADVDIAMDSGLFVRLGCGRTTATQHRDQITITGDERLGTRLVDNLAFTI